MKHYTTTHYNLTWMKGSKFPSPINSFIISSPREEQNYPAANFQEPFGGLIWPPRSYTCTFCRREFRSAQALGGHMNVHRRDRARLKQSSPPQPAETDEILNHRKQTSGSYQESMRFSAQENLSEESRNEGFVETKLSMGIDLVDRGTNVICKRHKKSGTVSSPLPFLHSKLCSTSSSMEDIDLELRLGDPQLSSRSFSKEN